MLINSQQIRQYVIKLNKHEICLFQQIPTGHLSTLVVEEMNLNVPSDSPFLCAKYIQQNHLKMALG
jgi:hypothetical protein